MRVSLAVLFLVSMSACFNTKPVVAPVDPQPQDGPPSVYVLACDQLTRLGCPEGERTKSGSTCAEHLERMSDLVVVPLSCVEAAPTREAVRECGTHGTLRFRCEP